MVKPTKPIKQSMIQPLESVHSEVIIPKIIKIKDIFDSCLNCGSDLNKDLKCDDCGYDRNIVYNLSLETKKERERNEAE